MKNIFIFIIISLLFLTSCNTVRESAGVNRKVIDEYAVIENPPLVIPPNFNLLPPEQIKSKDIENTDTDLAKEILFGLDDETSEENNEFSLIKETRVNGAEDSIRDKINEEFASQKSSVNDESIFESEEDLSKAIEQTNKKMTNISDENSKKEKKKKKFFFF